MMVLKMEAGRRADSALPARPVSRTRIAVLLALTALGSSLAYGEEPTNTQAENDQRKMTAVALNYSRASLHRIRHQPDLAVLVEEQEKILNHLNLNGVTDEEVIRLYSGVLDEVAQIQIAEQEREMVRRKHRRAIRSMLTGTAFALTAQMATLDYVGAVRTGAGSWWDYRNIAVTRETEHWKVEKDRWNAVVQKSNQFLDVSWKLARSKQIPDRWLVRGDDLDRLDNAWKEEDPDVRLRVLRRMEPFMECYPPYWYYVARTEQQQGNLVAAASTYEQMATLGDGHFRRDEMLATGLANLALIESHLARPTAPATAQRALAQCTDAWEANLVCAAVLEKHGKSNDAEDAILRNLDVALESTHSRLSLLGLYYHRGDVAKLSAQLADAEIVQMVPPAILLRCASKLKADDLPETVRRQLASSVYVTPKFNLGADDVVVQFSPAWELANAELVLTVDGRTHHRPIVQAAPEQWTATFPSVADWGSPWTGVGQLPELTIAFRTGKQDPTELTLAPSTVVGRGGSRTTVAYVPALIRHEGAMIALQPGREIIGSDSSSLAGTTPSASPTGVLLGIEPIEPGRGSLPGASTVSQPKPAPTPTISPTTPAQLPVNYDQPIRLKGPQ
jgi:hypothetical protein